MRNIISLFLLLTLVFIGDISIRSQDKSAENEHYQKALQATTDDEKATWLEKTIQLNPQNIEARLSLGQIYLRQKQFAKAKAQFSAIVLEDSNNNTALILLGDAQRALGDPTGAKSFYETAFQRDRKNTAVLFKIIEICISQKQFAEAEKRIKSYFTEFGITNADAWFYWGQLNQAKGDFKEAKSGFQAALKYDPQHNQAGSALQKLANEKQLAMLASEVRGALKKGNTRLALDKIEAIKRVNPHYSGLRDLTQKIAAAFIQAGEQAIDIGDKQEAYRLYKKAQSLDPAYPGLSAKVRRLESEFNQAEHLENRYSVATDAYAQENWKVAIFEFQEIMKIESNYKNVHSLLKIAREKQQLAAPVIQPGQTVVKVDFQQIFKVGDSLCTAGQWQAAIDYFRTKFGSQPKFAPARAKMYFAQSMLAIKRQRWSGAITLIEKALAILPEDSMLLAARYYSNAQIDFAGNRMTEARDNLLAIRQLGVPFLAAAKQLAALEANEFRQARSISKLSKFKNIGIGITAFILIFVIVLLIRNRRKVKSANMVLQATTIAKSASKRKTSRFSAQVKTIPKSRVQDFEDTDIPTDSTPAEELLMVESTGVSEEPEIYTAGGNIQTRNRRGRYERLEEIGKGAMGKVYKAYDHKMERTIVLKEIWMEHELSTSDYEKLKIRFLREARSAGRLHHPNIITVFDIINEQNKLFISMEYLEGDNLLHLFNQKLAISMKRAVDIIRQTAGALYYAHQEGVVHRDIKPSNIMVLKNDQVKLVDFGVAKISDATTLTQFGSSLGTPSYMSPEQIEGREVDGRSDIFSLGVVFYEIVTGERPFKGESMASIIMKIMQAEPKSLIEINANIPDVLEKSILKMLRKNPNQRYQSAMAIVNDLNEIHNRL